MVDTGTTSACAENTGNPAGKKTLSRNYLRVRGEYQADANRHFVTGELPPRARRIPLTPMCLRQQQGTTSACAENTVVDHRPRRPRGNYLRVRGEYLLQSHFAKINVELPPRARRIHAVAEGLELLKGTTSACEENTDHSLQPRRMATELPPRARRILHKPHARFHQAGTTSACAENTHAGH